LTVPATVAVDGARHVAIRLLEQVRGARVTVVTGLTGTVTESGCTGCVSRDELVAYRHDEVMRMRRPQRRAGAEGPGNGSGGVKLIIKSIGFCAAGPASVAVTP
jgi:hypothetical protein